MNQKIKKGIFIASTPFIVFSSIKSDTRYAKDCEVINEEVFAKYSKGSVYIGQDEYIDSIKDMVGQNDILVCDERDSKDPNMKIYNSYLITDSDIQNEILQILQIYEDTYPSDWDRTILSMSNEWVAHNVLYYLNYESSRSKDVDLDNKDEKVYQLARY